MSPLRHEAPVPVEYRLLGLDRRLIWPTASVYLVVFLWSGVMPAINEAVHNKEVLAGTVYNVGPVRFTPTQGWVITKTPFPVGSSSNAVVFKDGVTFSVKSGVWKGTAEELLNQIVKDQKEFVVEGKLVPVTTLQKVAGLGSYSMRRSILQQQLHLRTISIVRQPKPRVRRLRGCAVQHS